MKLTQEQKDSLKNYMELEDWEAVHGQYDKYMTKRLKEVDLEFFNDLEEITKGATFWFA